MECQICFEHFDSKSFAPKILVKCGHSFCRICIERLSNKKSSIQCPICREITKINKRENLPTNYSLQEMIEKANDPNIKNILLKYKFFDDKHYTNIQSTIIRYNDPKKLILKKITNNDFIYIEEFENGQNYSLFQNMTKRNRRYNFNRNSNFFPFFNEYSFSLFMFRKSSTCKHSHSCLEYIIRRLLYSLCVGVMSKYPLKFFISFLFNKFSSDTNNAEEIIKYTKIFQWAAFGFSSLIGVLKCLFGFYIDDYLKLIH